MTERVLITDGHWRKSLASVRALGREGIHVTVGESTRLATAAFSRYCRRRIVYPSPLLRPEAFADFLERELTATAYRMLLPMEDETVEIASLHRGELSRKTYVPVPAPEILLRARRKDLVIQEARALGIPTPRTWVPEGPSDLSKMKDRLPCPVVVKPRMGSGAVGVMYPDGPDALEAAYRAVHRRFPRPVIQERIPRRGVGFGASVLLDEGGRVKASFVHMRLREYPVTGGASTLRESVRRDDIRDMAVTLLKSLGWFGAAMVEFKHDPRDGQVKLLEVNPRFWGSLALAVAAGVNFPYLLCRMSRGERFSPVEDYRVGLRCRWLLPGDILHFISNPRRGELVREFFRFRDPKTVYDIVSVRDPLPTLARILTPLTFLYDPDMKHRMRTRRP
ncbi:MAG: ATP-grasp domain-containing protein [Deltaproteobacteria bacterium]|nr:ATP-grasp domain-containing protein [Deltaproteobacteria bacterium]MBW1924830.1 ATP-grasp domain-containing protein [Deltaproteobacteria bacterium]MBW1948511.1 ATP-grasp domain-containing protein [Deltaproteobacteria bacterium]MBW2006676.1 ATP-grasp domain-containing protein [Deltaproteobacteria bacterium]MBW2101214.1 ATP-grasp domain-containing protein [Deltaproteobacteria bacterium]